ncbi:non-ribosomal peptide synthetase [Pseudodesulfovibrio sp. zrk46]|uniref:non-ribosomal peptide synthetase n=1 Tax=Pseudodesulfovibrio sp. zrk46 TaxID=2725288 RepID=UPI001448D571|nr:non-ribosomal peptide synthetase [Pseudodesulfovibrio sp. zrk46]QJB57028.1 amino acid adenylation domain-containing protein [Pseudodesulfovibrio sp. zrk46]
MGGYEAEPQQYVFIMQTYPLSHPQRRIWFAEAEYPNTAINTIALYVPCPKGTSFEALQDAINGCVRDNEALRARIAKGSAGDESFGACQFFSEYRPFELEHKEFSDSETAHQWMLEQALVPMELYRSPLFRFTGVSINGAIGYFYMLHHIVSDGRTTMVLMEEIERRLSDPSIVKTIDSYKDFIEFENTYKKSSAFNSDRTFWMNELSSFPEPLKLANGNGEEDAELIQVASVVSEDLHSKIHSFADQYGVSVYKQIMSAFGVYIAKATRSESFAVGIANHNRSEKRFYDMCGMFVSTLPFVFDFDPQKSFAEYALESSQRINNILKKHSRYPLDLLVSDMRREYDIDVGHIMNVSIVGHPNKTDAPAYEIVLPGQSRNSLNIHINLAGTDGEGKLEILFMADGEVYSKQDIDTLYESLTAILNQALSAPDTPVGQLSLVSEREKQRVLSFNPRFEAYRDKLSIPALFKERVSASPDHIALMSTEGSVTYAELDAWTDNIAHGLMKLNKGVSLSGQYVGISMTRSISMIAAIMGILKSGAAYVPLDPEYPEERLAFMAEDAGIGIVLANDGHEKLFSSLTAVDINDFPKGRMERIEDMTGPDDQAYAIYTSGTTGKPKGVPIQHHQVINLVDGLKKAFFIDRKSRVLQFASLNFDASVAEIFPALLTGATLVVALEEHRSDANVLGRMLEEMDVSVATIPPAMLAIMPYKELPALSSLVVAGESTDPDAIKQWSKGRKLINAYGPTENTVAATAGLIDGNSLPNDIGTPLKNVSCYILDPYMQLLPVGIPGELFIGGLQVSKGYINRAELNAKAFFENPFATKEARNPRNYKSGDLVRWMDTGHIEFIGRVDFQVKIRGHRIECGEVGTAISRMDGVNSCLVIPLPSGATHKLVAYVIPSSDKKALITPDFLRTEAANVLPDYMVPSAFVIMDKFPMTPGSKIDRRKLPQPAHDDTALTEYMAPRNEIERKLVKIWQDLLELEQVGVLDDFFDVGGDSLLCMSLIAEAEDQGLNIDIAMVRKQRTIANLAQVLIETGDVGPQLPSLKKRLHNRPEPMPLNALMMRRQEQAMIAAGVPSPASITTWQMNGPMDENIMLDALDALVARHDALRIRISEEGSEVRLHPVTTAGPGGVINTSREELPALINQWVEGDRNDNYPSCEFRLFRFSRTEHALVMVGTHELLDAWAMRKMSSELVELYNASKEGREPDLEPEPYQVMDFTDWYNGLVENGRLEESRLYWKEQLDGVQPVFDTSPQPDTAQHKYASVSSMQPLPIKLRNDFEALCKQTGCTFFEGLLTAHMVLFGRKGDKEDVLTAYVTALRDRTELQNLIGCLTNRLYIRATIDTDHFKTCVNRVQTVLQEGTRHALWPTWQDVDPNGQGYPDIFFHYVPFFEQTGPQFVDFESRMDPPAPMKHWPLPLALVVVDHDERPVLQCMAQAGFCDADFANELLTEYLKILEDLVAASS